MGRKVALSLGNEIGLTGYFQGQGFRLGLGFGCGRGRGLRRGLRLGWFWLGFLRLDPKLFPDLGEDLVLLFLELFFHWYTSTGIGWEVHAQPRERDSTHGF